MGVVNWSNFEFEYDVTGQDWKAGRNIGEAPTGPGVTVPGMTLSLGDLLKRYVRGGQVTTFTPVYTDDEMIPDDLERMDEIERIEAARALAGSIDEFRTGLGNKKRAKSEPPPSELGEDQ